MTTSVNVQPHPPGSLVTIFHNWESVSVPSGQHSLSDLKALGNFDNGPVEQLVNGELVRLHNHDSISVTGGEIFFTGHVVQITVNDERIWIPSGKHTAAYIKMAAQEPATDCIDQLVGTEYKPLKDTDTVKINGDEVFVVQPKTGKVS